MTNNIMQQYIKNIKTFLTSFTKLFLEELYIEKISNEYIKTYIEARVYNYGAEGRFFYKRIYDSLTTKKKEIEEELDKKVKEKQEVILEKNLKIYQYILYIDGVRDVDDLEEFLSLICEKRQTEFNIPTKKAFKSKITKLINEYKNQKVAFLQSFDTKDFSLNIEKYTLIDNTYKVGLDYNFKVPYIYSNKVIGEVYNEGTINEDKLIIEYTLLVPVCIKDIENGNFETKYIVDFARTLYSKEKKIKQTLKVVNDPAIQDKIVFKIYYTDFTENKELLYSLIQDGFKFAIIIDDSFEVTDANLRKLNIFKYMLVTKDNKNYYKIKQRETKINNIIIYDI